VRIRTNGVDGFFMMLCGFESRLTLTNGLLVRRGAGKVGVANGHCPRRARLFSLRNWLRRPALVTGRNARPWPCSPSTTRTLAGLLPRVATINLCLQRGGPPPGAGAGESLRLAMGIYRVKADVAIAAIASVSREETVNIRPLDLLVNKLLAWRHRQCTARAHCPTPARTFDRTPKRDRL